MLHFLIGLALCIWIAERIAHYWSTWRLNRDVHRSLNYPPPIEVTRVEPRPPAGPDNRYGRLEGGA